MVEYNTVNAKISDSQLNKLKSAVKNNGFLGKLLGPLLKTGLPLIKNVIKPLAESVLIPLGLTAQHLLLMLEYKKNTSFWNNNLNNFK